MKVAYLLGSLNRGGLETLLMDVLLYAREAGIDAVCVYRKSGHYEEKLKQLPIPSFQVRPEGIWDIFYFLRLRKTLLKQQVEIVHAQTALDAFFAYVATRFTGIQLALTLHGYDWNSKSIQKQLIRFVLFKVALVCFVSKHECSYYIHRYHLKATSKHVVVYNGIDFSKIKNNVQNHKTTLTLGTVGNFTEVRDQLTLCKFLALLKQEGIPFDFYFVGGKVTAEPYLYDQCVQYCNDHNLLEEVHFLGSRNDVSDWLASFDAFVYATHHDTFGIAVVEAIAAGIPTFVNDWEVMKEVTNHGEWAYLYQTGNPQDLLRIFLSFLTERATYEHRAQIAAQAVRNQYSIEQYIRNLKVCYEQLDTRH